ncbi:MULTISPECIES: hypothetical protein [Bacteria]|uniref:hypothetical protein n=1 Tax=Bacteria TaxID=2 RepID=UPI002E7AF812|nr:hypothetical protein [Cetobacterium somerae]WVJ02992.1 hypothetical protein VSU16_14775 [Cetobacterium somerae]
MLDEYIESPIDCKIFLKYKSSSGTELKEVLLTQTLNYRITENKKPVYGFNRNRFGQVIKGKRLIEGVIVLKKSIFNEIGDLIDLSSINNSSRKLTTEKIAYLKSVLPENTNLMNLVKEYEKDAAILYEMEKIKLEKSKKYNIFNTLPQGTNLIVAFGSVINSNEFKLKYKKILEKDSIDYATELEKLIKSDSELVIEDINFLEKTGEINISKSDIDEVYKFFGSLDNWEQ